MKKFLLLMALIMAAAITFPHPSAAQDDDRAVCQTVSLSGELSAGDFAPSATYESVYFRDQDSRANHINIATGKITPLSDFYSEGMRNYRPVGDDLLIAQFYDLTIWAIPVERFV